MIIVLTTTDKKTVAAKIGKALLTKKLIACCSILPVDSSYWWKGKIVSDKEFQLILKTKAGNFAKIEKIIKKLHTYELPEVLSIKIDKAGKDYLKWMNEAIK